MQLEEADREELERYNDWLIGQVSRIEWLEQAAWNLAVHDMAADKRDRQPSCMELYELLSWFRDYKPHLIEQARKAYPKILDD